jgi:hypothetical protein
MIINFLSRISDCVVMRWDRHSLTAFGGIAALVIGGALLLEDAEINPRRWGIRRSETSGHRYGVELPAATMHRLADRTHRLPAWPPRSG